MAKEVAISKRAKISEAQQYMLLSVFTAAVFLGVALSLIMRFVQQISFNSQVIAEEDASIVKYSNAIKTTGICASPKGSIYSDGELDKCNPDNIDVSSIPSTLRYNILKNLAGNEALNSVEKEKAGSNCINPATNKNYTYAELEEKYENATDSNGLKTAVQMIKSCSSLRVIPDALPSFKNAEALGASINRIFIEADWSPDAITVSPDATTLGGHLNSLGVNFAMDRTDVDAILRVLRSFERSIREFDISSISIQWNDQLTFSAQAVAYYMDNLTISETTKTLKPGGNKK